VLVKLQALAFGSFATTAAGGFTVFPVTAFITSIYIAVHEFPLKEYFLDQY
jgi:hypothetical protein